MPAIDTADDNESNNVNESQDSLVPGQPEAGGVSSRKLYRNCGGAYGCFTHTC